MTFKSKFRFYAKRDNGPCFFVFRKATNSNFKMAYKTESQKI